MNAIHEDNSLSQLSPAFQVLRTTTQFLAPPVFNLQEHETHYVLTIDLPSLNAQELAIEVSKNRLQLIGHATNDESPASILFQYESSGKKVKAHYQNGSLQMVLPKNSLADLLDLPRLKRTLAEAAL